MSTILSLRVASFLFISCFFLFSFSSSFFFSSLLCFFLFFFSRLYSAVLEQSTEACYSLSSGYCVLPPTSPLLFLPLHVWIRPPHPPPSPGKVFRNHQRSSSKGFDTRLDWNCLVKRLETGLIIHSEKKKSLRLQIQPVQFCNSAESYPRVYVSWTWKGGRCRGPSWGHWSRERWCVCAPCCAPALKLDFHLHTVHTRPMQSCQETAIAKHERCTFSNDGKFYLDFFFVFFTVSPMTGRNKKANNSIKWMKLYQMKYCPCQEDLTLPLPLGVS